MLAALAIGAFLLLPTAVPEDLSLALVDAGQVFGADFVSRAHRYQRFLLLEWALSEYTLLAVLWIYARRGAVFTRESQAGPIGTGMLLGMLGLAIVWLVRLPFRLVEHWWERRNDLSSMSYLEWLLQDWVILGAEFLSICLALVIVMALARRLGERWWVPGAAAFVAIAALFSFVAPYLVYGLTPLRDERLAVSAARYEREQGLSHIPFRVEEVSNETSQANAFSFGMGPSRRVVLWDTLLRAPFTLGEQQVVVAHELGHLSSRHIPKGLAWFALFAFPGAWILMRATRRRGGMGTAESVPLALLVVAVLELAAAPAQNWISRRAEAEADWKALQSTRDPRSFERLMVDLSRPSLDDPSPPTWAYLLLSDHPTGEQRVAMAHAWAKLKGELVTKEHRDLWVQTGVVHVQAPPRGCWTLTVDGKARAGCGSQDLRIRVVGETEVAVEKRDRGAWGLGLSFSVGGRQVAWLAPFTAEEGQSSFRYDVPQPAQGRLAAARGPAR